jgi:hypothetical protein
MNEIKKHKDFLLSEIKVNRPTKVWDFNKYIPNLDPNRIQVGDRLIIPVQSNWTVNLNGFDGLVTEIGYNMVTYGNKLGDFTFDYLIKINNENK